MGYLGSLPATNFETVKKDRYTSITGTGITLSHSVSSVQDIIVWVNSVKQDYTSYSVNGTTLTLGGSLVSSDITEVAYIGRTFQTVNPAADSVTASQIADNSISEEHLDPTIITGQTAEATVATDDTILIHDTSASALRKMTRSNFVSGIGGNNTPAFEAHLNSTQSVSDNTWTKINMNTEVFDTASAYDNSSNYRFTVPSGKAGKYFVWGFLQAYATYDANDISKIAIYKNGSAIVGATEDSRHDGSRVVALHIHSVLDLAVNDYLEIYGLIDVSSSSPEFAQHSGGGDGGYNGTRWGAFKIIE
mgnify:CR=1 FL=1